VHTAEPAVDAAEFDAIGCAIEHGAAGVGQRNLAFWQ
jgi:hypothetical protein